MAKTRKPAARSGSTKKTKASSTRKAVVAKGKKKTTTRAAPRKVVLNLKPFKKKLREHLEVLTRSRSVDPRVQGALASLRRLQEELDEACIPTMTLPLN